MTTMPAAVDSGIVRALATSSLNGLIFRGIVAIQGYFKIIGVAWSATQWPPTVFGTDKPILMVQATLRLYCMMRDNMAVQGY
jgi:hypothetical protein